MTTPEQKREWLDGAAKLRSAAEACRMIARKLNLNGTAEDVLLAAKYEDEATKSENIAERAEARGKGVIQ